MQVTIVNRLKNADNKIIQDVNIQIPELIGALWRSKPSKVGLLFSKAPKQPPTPEHTQQIMNLAILGTPSLKFSKIYGKRLSGVELISNNKLFWANLIIDEQRYFEAHSKKNTNLIDGLISAYSTPIKTATPTSSTPSSMPELRPIDEVNPVYPSMKSIAEEPKKESNLNSEKNKNNLARFFIHAVVALTIGVTCIAIGLNWLIALPAVVIPNLVVFLATNHFQNKFKKVPVAEKMVPAETGVPNSQLKSTSSIQLPVPDSLSILFSRKSSKPQPLNTNPSSEFLENESTSNKKMAKHI